MRVNRIIVQVLKQSKSSSVLGNMSTKRDQQSPCIVVIGAGAAGISATHRLLERGFQDVVLLEALGRVGGRINTVRVCDGRTAIELGANWVHGACERNLTLHLARKYGVKMVNYEDSARKLYLRADGTVLQPYIVAKANQIYDRCLEEVWTKRPGDPNDYTESLKEYYCCKIDTLIKDIPKEERDDVQSVLNSYLLYQICYEGEEMEKVSRAQRFGEELPGGERWVPSGYDTVYGNLVKELPEGVLKLNTQVKKIDWSSNDKEGVLVKCKSGKVFNAHHVIVTCSIGYLKRHHQTLFKPMLPQVKADVIEQFGYGRVNKLFLVFRNPILEREVDIVYFCRDQLTVVSWFDAIHCFTVLPHDRRVLFTGIGGDAAELVERMDNKEIGRCCAILLRTFLRDDSLPLPVEVYVSKWCSEPHFLGSYSYASMTSRSDQIQILAEPLLDMNGKPVVLFAGEATHEQHYSTTNGARATGLREADRLADIYFPQQI